VRKGVFVDSADMLTNHDLDTNNAAQFPQHDECDEPASFNERDTHSVKSTLLHRLSHVSNTGPLFTHVNTGVTSHQTQEKNGNVC
jgi:hypothetical protein